MQNKKSKFNEYAKFMRPFAILLVMIVVLTATTWAWVRREWAPYLSSGENGMSIATTDALVFNMDVTDSGDDQLASSKTINAILNVNHFELKPVSNATGMSDTFYKINYGNTQEEYTFINIGNGVSNMEIGKENGYVDITFWVQGSGSTKTQYVYLHKDSHIGTPGSLLKDSEKAIRVAITAGSQTYLFSAEGNRAKDDSDFYPYKAVSKAGPVYVEKDGELVWNQSCISQLGADAFKTFDAYNGYDENNNKEYGKCLFTVSGQERVAIRVKIWLEGEDELCDEHIISDFIDLMIKFTAYSGDEPVDA